MCISFAELLCKIFFLFVCDLCNLLWSRHVVYNFVVFFVLSCVKFFDLSSMSLCNTHLCKMTYKVKIFLCAYIGIQPSVNSVTSVLCLFSDTILDGRCVHILFSSFFFCFFCNYVFTCDNC